MHAINYLFDKLRTTQRELNAEIDRIADRFGECAETRDCRDSLRIASANLSKLERAIEAAAGIVKPEEIFRNDAARDVMIAANDFIKLGGAERVETIKKALSKAAPLFPMLNLWKEGDE